MKNKLSRNKAHFVIVYPLLIASLGLGAISLGGVGGGSLRLWEVLLGGVILSLLIKASMRKEIKIKTSLPMVFTCLYFYSVLISGANAIDHGLWLKRTTLIGAFILLFFVVSQKSNVKELTSHWKWVLYPGIIIAIFGISDVYLFQSAPDVYKMFHRYDKHQQSDDPSDAKLQIFEAGVLRARAFFPEANEFSQYLSLPFGFLLAIFFFRRDRMRRKWIYLIGLLTVLMAQIASLSRGGILAFCAQFIAIFFVIFKSGTQWDRNIRKMAPAVLAIFIIGIIFLNEDIKELFYIMGQRIISTSSDSDYSSNERLMSIESGLSVAGASVPNFIIGVGAGNLDVSSAAIATTSNYLVDILAETGIIGLLSFLGLIFSLLFLSHKSMRNHFLISDNDSFIVFVGAYLALIGMLIGGLTASTHLLCFFWFISGLLLAICQYGKMMQNGKL